MNRYKMLAGLFALDVVLFAISGIPTFKNADHGVNSVIGYGAWFGVMACTLVLIVLGVMTMIQHFRTSRRSA